MIMPVAQRNRGQTHQQEQEEAPNRPGMPSHSPCAQPLSALAGAQTYRTISTSLVEATIWPRGKLGAPKIVPMWWFDIDVAVAAKLGTKKNKSSLSIAGIDRPPVTLSDVLIY